MSGIDPLCRICCLIDRYKMNLRMHSHNSLSFSAILCANNLQQRIESANFSNSLRAERISLLRSTMSCLLSQIRQSNESILSEVNLYQLSLGWWLWLSKLGFTRKVTNQILILTTRIFSFVTYLKDYELLKNQLTVKHN